MPWVDMSTCLQETQDPVKYDRPNAVLLKVIVNLFQKSIKILYIGPSPHCSLFGIANYCTTGVRSTSRSLVRTVVFYSVEPLLSSCGLPLRPCGLGGGSWHRWRNLVRAGWQDATAPVLRDCFGIFVPV